MKNLFAFVITIIIGLNSVFASGTNTILKKKKARKAFVEGQQTVHAGVGFVPYLLSSGATKDLELYGEVTQKGIPVIGLRYEVGVNDFLSVGGLLGISSKKVSVTDVSNPNNVNGFDMSFTVLGGRAAYHLVLDSDLGQKLDPYVGGMLGFCITGAKPTGDRNYFDKPKGFGLAYAAYAGANFYLVDNVALFAEIGYKFALINAGITIKL